MDHKRHFDIRKLKGIVMAIRKETILVLFLVGALLLIIVWPTGSKGEQTAPGSKASRDTKLQTEQEEESLWDYKRRVEEELETILEKMEGVGQTNVMINVGDSGKTVVEKDVAVSEHSEGEKDTKTLVDSDRSEETVFTENEDGEQPFVVNTLSPQIQGVLVVAEGGDDPEVRAKVLEAVMALFQLESHKISIVKGN